MLDNVKGKRRTKRIPGERRRITRGMIQWAKEQGACENAVRAMRVGMTFRRYFARKFSRQLFVIDLLDMPLNSPWSFTDEGSEAEFQEFLKIVNKWEIV